MAVGRLTPEVRGLVLSVKEYERLAVRAAVEKSAELARLALFTLPIIGQWEAAEQIIDSLGKSDPEHLGYLNGTNHRK